MRPHTPSALPTPEPSRSKRERKRGLGATQNAGEGQTLRSMCIHGMVGETLRSMCIHRMWSRA